jgi:hypothetical protein
MTATEAVREMIEGHLRTIDAEVVSLREALDRLEAGEAPAVRRDEPRRRAGRAQRRRRRTGATRRVSPESVDIAGLLAATSEGLTTAAIAEQTGLERDQALGLVKDLESKGQVRRSGQRRGVRWHAITDEDRIRERAAELEKASRAARERRAA